MPCMNAGVGKEMAADYDHRSCLPSGASRIWSRVYNRQQESNQGRTAGGRGGRVGGGGGVGGGRGGGVINEDWTGAWISTVLNTHVDEDCFFHYRQHST